MIDQRLATLTGSTGLFAAVSLALLSHPELAVSIFPAYGLLFLWSDFRREKESHIIFLFLVSLVGLVLASRAGLPDQRPALALELIGLWLLNGALAAHQGWEQARLNQASADGVQLESQIRDDERELAYYRSYQESVDSQIRFRRDLTEGARSLGSTMDGREVYVRLSNILALRFPSARISITGGAAGDPLLELVSRTAGPVLVKDAASDNRLDRARSQTFRSGLALPLKVMKRASGFVKLEADAPGVFSPDDVRTVDLLSTMAGLTMENIQIYENVHQQATHDALTQLYSHKAFQQRLKEELLRSGRSQSPLSFILCDIDHFKHYNDRYGHQAGDQLLKTVAGIIASFARPVDFPARYGGEEFCLILPNFVRTEAVDLANRLRLRIEAEPFYFQGQKSKATMSMGVSSYPQDATTESQIIRVADERLYRAKDNGRNQVVG